MSLGEKIRELRINKNITQKQLADQLNVTTQAVSRWENDAVEPSVSTIKQMASIFNVSTDELLNQEKIESQPEVKPEYKEKIVERYVESRAILGVCEECKNPIYEKDDLIFKHVGRRKKIVCSTCENARIANEKKQFKANCIKYRWHSFVFGGIIGAILMAILISYGITENDKQMIPAGIVLGIMAFTFVSCMILRNNFISDLWIEVFSWGFIHLPGIIFDLSLEGIVSLICIKILGSILCFLVASATAVLATILAMILSVFTYPYAIIKCCKDIKNN